MEQQNTSNEMNTDTDNTVPDYGEPWQESCAEMYFLDRHGDAHCVTGKRRSRAIACVNLLAGHDLEKVEVVPKEVMEEICEAIKEAHEALANVSPVFGRTPAQDAALAKLNALKP